MPKTTEGWQFDETRYKAIWQKYAQTQSTVPDEFCKICAFDTDDKGNMTAHDSAEFMGLVVLPTKTEKKGLEVRACPSCDNELIKTALS